jgi:hypothetical protein
MDKGLLVDLIYKFVENAEDARDKPHDAFNQGRHLAYYEVLSSIKNVLTIHYPDNISDYGLDFDIDKHLSSEAKAKLLKVV